MKNGQIMGAGMKRAHKMAVLIGAIVIPGGFIALAIAALAKFIANKKK